MSTIRCLCETTGGLQSCPVHGVQTYRGVTVLRVPVIAVDPIALMEEAEREKRLRLAAEQEVERLTDVIGPPDKMDGDGLLAGLWWALDMLDEYDEKLIAMGEPRERVYSTSHLGGKAKARTALIKAGWHPPVVRAALASTEEPSPVALLASEGDVWPVDDREHAAYTHAALAPTEPEAER